MLLCGLRNTLSRLCQFFSQLINRICNLGGHVSCHVLHPSFEQLVLGLKLMSETLSFLKVSGLLSTISLQPLNGFTIGSVVTRGLAPHLPQLLLEIGFSRLQSLQLSLEHLQALLAVV